MTIFDKIQSGEATITELRSLPVDQRCDLFSALLAEARQEAEPATPATTGQTSSKPVPAPEPDPCKEQVQGAKDTTRPKPEWSPTEAEKNPGQGPARTDGGYSRGGTGWNRKGSINL